MRDNCLSARSVDFDRQRNSQKKYYAIKYIQLCALQKLKLSNYSIEESNEEREALDKRRTVV